MTFYGVVLAPFVNDRSNTEGAVNVVCGEDASNLLGGLRQVSRRLEPEAYPSSFLSSSPAPSL